MMKVTVLYGHPDDPGAFEDYYASTHLPIAATMKGVAKLEATKFVETPDGMPAYYRMAEVYFDSPQQMETTLASPEGQATVGDIPNFASGGFTVVVGSVDG